MFTGVYPTVHKIRDTGGFVMQSSDQTLAQVLQQQFVLKAAIGPYRVYQRARL